MSLFRQSVLTASLALVVSGAASGLDWGVNLNEAPLALLGQTTLYVESVKAKAWLTQPVFDADLKLEGEGSFSAVSTGKAWKAGTPSFDLTEASLKGTSPLAGGTLGVAEWDLGRRNITDLSGGWVIGSRWDGVGINWLRGSTKLSGSVGYSGLLSKKTSRITGSSADAADFTNTKVFWAPQRIYGAMSFGWNELFARQDFQTELLGDLDLRSGGDAVHGVYSTVSTNGPLPLGWRQRTFVTTALRLTPSDKSWASIGGVELSATIPYLGSRLVFNAVGSRGFQGTGFQAVSGKGLAEVITLPSTQAAATGADFSLKPWPKTTVGGKTSVLFRTSKDPAVIPGFKASSQAAWLGTEAGAYGSWTPTSELSLGFNAGVFVPQPSAFEPKTLPTILVVVTATLKL